MVIDPRIYALIIAVACCGSALAQTAPAQQGQIYAFPAAGQTAEQQQRDRYECHTWAVQQSGYDPAQPQAAAAQPQTQAQHHESSGGGAAKGAVTGAVMGHAARGAVIGGLREHMHEKKEAEAQHQMQQMQAQQ